MENQAVEPIVFKNKRRELQYEGSTAHKSHGKRPPSNDPDRQRESEIRCEQLAKEILERRKQK